MALWLGHIYSIIQWEQLVVFAEDGDVGLIKVHTIASSMPFFLPFDRTKK